MVYERFGRIKKGLVKTDQKRKSPLKHNVFKGLLLSPVVRPEQSQDVNIEAVARYACAEAPE